MRAYFFKLILAFVALIQYPVWADDEMAEMQRKLNQQVMERPFAFRNEQDVERYIEKTLKSGKAPDVRPGKHWRRGYTCADLRIHSLHEYANCLAYYRYYGKYW